MWHMSCETYLGYMKIICMIQTYFKITIQTEMVLVEISDRDEEPFLMNGQF